MVWTMNSENLPNFFIIGAAKSGTTTLFNILSQHPQVYFPFQKEPNFFCNDKFFSRGLDWYANTFFESASNYPLRGEASPQYLYWGEKAAARIQAIYKSKDLKFIAILRDPVKRAYSHYWMLVHRELEDLSFVEALEAEDVLLLRHWDELEKVGSLRYGYFRGGQYARQLELYLEQFSIGQFHFILLDDLKNDFAGTMTGLVQFLGIQTDFTFQQVTSNPAYKARNPKLHHFLHHPSGRFYRLIRAVLKKTSYPFQYRLRRKILEKNLEPVTNPGMDPQVENRLRKRFLTDIEQLEKIIGKDLSLWKKVSD
jgi:hypothetical protein